MRTYAYFARTGLVSRREMQVYLVALYLIHDDIPQSCLPVHRLSRRPQVQRYASDDVK